MDDRKDLDAWADALLDQHRTVPAGSARAGAEPMSSPDDPLMLRLATKISGEPPAPHVRERLRRQRKRHGALQRIEATVMTVVAIVSLILVVLAAATLSFF